MSESLGLAKCIYVNKATSIYELNFVLRRKNKQKNMMQNVSYLYERRQWFNRNPWSDKSRVTSLNNVYYV